VTYEPLLTLNLGGTLPLLLLPLLRPILLLLYLFLLLHDRRSLLAMQARPKTNNLLPNIPNPICFFLCISPGPVLQASLFGHLVFKSVFRRPQRNFQLVDCREALGWASALCLFPYVDLVIDPSTTVE
jgi:hypothetical protein